MKMTRWGTAAIAAVMVTGAALHADVRTQERTQMKFEGMLGRMAGMFGGKAAKEGIVDTTAVKGNRKLVMNDTTGQFIDLDEEKVYELDVKKKRYTVMTFEEMRKRLDEARQKATESAARMQGRDPQASEGQPQKEMDIDFDIKETGQRKAVAGHDAREVVTTITVREKGKTIEESGGMVLTASSWLGPKVDALDELRDFDRRFFERLYGQGALSGEADQMAMVMAMYPAMKDAMEKMKAENVKLEGTPLLTTMTFETVQGKAQAAEQTTSDDEKPSGLGGFLARKMGGGGQQAGPGGRSLIMTTTTEMLSVSPDAGEVAIPAGFKQK